MVGLKDGHIALRCPPQYGPSFPLGFVPDFTVVLLRLTIQQEGVLSKPLTLFGILYIIFLQKHESRAIKEPLPGGLCPIEFATPKKLEEHPR